MSAQKNKLEREAAAFDKRISERVNAGFIPDLRQAVHCEYFYKSFWRDPHFIDLYLGRIHSVYVNLLRRYCDPKASILDVGCGAGYMSLELAREGYHVTGFDISPACIEQARRMLATNPYTSGFGSLDYKVMALDEATGQYDVVMFGGSLHHIDDTAGALAKVKGLLKPGGHVLCYEPCHEEWRYEDAAQVALIRGLLTLTGNWYEPEALRENLRDEAGLDTLIRDIHDEYVEERDKTESGQSPNDNAASGFEMLKSLREHFQELEIRYGHSFIYRLLGGIRGTETEVHEIAEFVAAYDRYSVRNHFMKPNAFFFIGRKLADPIAENREADQ